MDYSEYKKLKEEIEAEYQKKKEALDMVWRMCQQHDDSNIANAERSSNISISGAIRKVINELPGDFSTDDIEQGLKDHDVKNVKRIIITNTLHRLQRRNEIEVVVKGVGRIGGKYRKKIQKVEDKI